MTLCLRDCSGIDLYSGLVQCPAAQHGLVSPPLSPTEQRAPQCHTDRPKTCRRLQRPVFPASCHSSSPTAVAPAPPPSASQRRSRRRSVFPSRPVTHGIEMPLRENMSSIAPAPLRACGYARIGTWNRPGAWSLPTQNFSGESIAQTLPKFILHCDDPTSHRIDHGDPSFLWHFLVTCFSPASIKSGRLPSSAWLCGYRPSPPTPLKCRRDEGTFTIKAIDEHRPLRR